MKAKFFAIPKHIFFLFILFLIVILVRLSTNYLYYTTKVTSELLKLKIQFP